MFGFDRWKGWCATPALMRRMLMEATLELLRARLLIAFRLKASLPSLLRPAKPSEAMPPVQMQRDVRAILRIASERVPWKCLCLPTAIAAKRMLARRGYGSTLRLGVGHTAVGDPHAHAWLEAGEALIIGEDGMAGITALPTMTLRANER